MTIKITETMLLTALLATAAPALARDLAQQAPASGDEATPATKPDETAKKPDETAKKPDETAKKPDETAKKPDETAKKPDETAKKPEEAASKEEVRTLAEELRRLKLEIGLRDVEYQSFGGMGPAASKVYFAPKGLSIGGYGEVTYRNFTHDVASDQTDLLRAVLYAGYRFNERIVFNSEIEFEHAGREVSVEFAYLDFLFTDALRLRVGNVLVPIGFVNQMHEPPFFNGVFRPDVEQYLIPTTWSENGVGVHGEIAGLRYKAFLLNGLDVFRDAGDEPVEAASWLRESRTGGAESRAATAAGVLSLEYAAGPATVGGAVYYGRADQRRIPGVKAEVGMAELHGQLAWRGATARVLGVVGTLGDAAAVNANLVNGAGGIGLAPDEGLGSRVQGGYAELAYDVLSLFAPGGESSLSPFARVERYDLNARVPAGYVRNGAVDRTVVTAGLTYKPIPTVVVKTDWQRKDPRTGDTTDQVNVGAGFVF
ncbi:hypothetical protein [Anaeromyxobacter oryzae]|uniref:Phosphate-selective porin O and P n=1 Tax=Anaeromyxobacter oryzae TaxID=2918170 RepID=A0ABM7X3P3_9BACT|nr:hypothetical protein [Anaeromyxobacter oryzae]BDG06419.1 hypothetical protein AMOR_54150 [Anaeromyxobacter oryzae]